MIRDRLLTARGSQMAGAVLMTGLLALASLVLWGERRAGHENAQARAAVRVSDAYDRLMYAVALEEGHAHTYAAVRSAATRADIEDSQRLAWRSLGAIGTGEAGRDRRSLEQTAVLLRAFQLRVRDVVRATDAHGSAAGARLHHEQLHTVFDRVNAQLARAGGAARAEALSRMELADRHRRQLVAVSIIGFALGLGLAAAVLAILAGYRRRVEHSRRAELEQLALEARLERAQRLEVVGQLAGGIAHDFNNLLGLILNYAGFVREGLHDRPDVHHDLEQIEAAAQNGAALTRELLAFARRETAAGGPIDLGAVLVDAERLLARTLDEQIEVSTSVEPGLPPVSLQRPHAEQVVMNLALNARDALADGGRLEMLVKGGQDADGEPYVALVVSDDGAGMPADVAAHAFEPFFTTKDDGSGLGLATVQSIAEKAGGSVELDSAAGRGTQVTVRLPVAMGHEGGAPEPEQAPAAAGGQTVLLVEYNGAVRTVTLRILSYGCFRVLEADTAEVGVLIASAWQIDVVVTDVIMPGASGPEMVRRLRADDPTLPVLYISGYNEERLEEEQPDDATLFLEKPFRADALLRSVHALLDATPCRRGVAV